MDKERSKKMDIELILQKYIRGEINLKEYHKRLIEAGIFGKSEYEEDIDSIIKYSPEIL